ncbi:hypothetical protein FJY94_00230 [Candidatus Kaiserbacteria bacterium]|nr:hypothetical protein [Candidatus Kaiserbacteria bacterium]
MGATASAADRFAARAVRSARALRFHRLLLRAGVATGSVFVWIGIYRYFYQQTANTGDAFTHAALLYALAQVTTVLLLPYAARLLSHGVRRSMIVGTSAIAIGFLALGAFGAVGSDVTLTLLFLAFAVLSGAYRAFYRMPHRIDAMPTGLVSAHTARKLVIMLAPAAAGVAMEYADMPLPAILGIAGGIAALSLIPLTRITETYERFAHGYQETFGVLAAREHRALLLHGISNGFEGAVYLFAWPIVIFLATDRSFLATGVALSTALVLALVLRYWGAPLVRPLSVPFVMVLAASAWMARMVASTPLGVVVVDTYAGAGASPRAGIDRAGFEQHADLGIYFDDYTIYKEMALALGRLVAALGVAAFAAQTALSFALVALFCAAAIASAIGVSTALTNGRTVY